jgi:phospholipase C
MSALDLIDTIVLVMLENRSFDHMLGHLSYGKYANGSDADGITSPLKRDAWVNVYQGEPYYPAAMRDRQLSGDLPHDRGAIATQLNRSRVTGTYAMDGFAKSYFAASPNNRTTKPDPLGFLLPGDVPMSRFLADNYAVCDRWFASLPAGTQPNRLMAWSGTTYIDGNGFLPPHDPLVIDWLERNGVRWRVYTSGLSFFLLLGSTDAFGPNFRGIERLAPDVMGEQPGDFPQVIVVEPLYGDAARIVGGVPNDDHAPAPVGPGELFLRKVYDALTRNSARWARTLLVVTYDEHGGFWDHVPPPAIAYAPPAKATFTKAFESLGVRVPGLVVSPLVSPKHVSHTVLDHTSVLQLLAEKFTPGTPYSPAVETRRQAGVGSVSAVLDLSVPRPDLPIAPDFSIKLEMSLGENRPPVTPLETTFEEAALDMVRKFPKPTAQKYPEVSHWVLTQRDRPYV